VLGSDNASHVVLNVVPAGSGALSKAKKVWGLHGVRHRLAGPPRRSVWEGNSWRCRNHSPGSSPVFKGGLRPVSLGGCGTQLLPRPRSRLSTAKPECCWIHSSPSPPPHVGGVADERHRHHRRVKHPKSSQNPTSPPHSREESDSGQRNNSTSAIYSKGRELSEIMRAYYPRPAALLAFLVR
jgi:hypothetical protein